jgi:predicted HD superfamily hydrolase involved in NAD metabolism
MDSVALLRHHGYPQTAGHSVRVAAEAQRIAARFGADIGAAAIAGWLHDISAIIPNSERVAWAEALGIDILHEERTLPMIIHQKLSARFARDLFAIRDEGILSAIGCHTTLRAGATLLDKVVFVADKIAWDQSGDPPYLDAIIAALDRSLDAAVLFYLAYLWELRDTLRVVHPWFVDAYDELSVV